MPGQVVPLGNPLSEEAGVLRPSLVPGMLTTVAGNLHRDVSDVRLFELGTVFSGATDKVDERPALGFAAVGALPEQSALHPARSIEFHDVKGVVEQVLARFQTRAVYFDRFPPETGLTPDWLHPYRAARVVADGLTVGWFGQLHPVEAASRKLKDPVLVGELYLDRLYNLPLRKPAAREISRFQPVRRDFSLILDQSIEWEKIDQALAALQIPELVEWRVREVFRDAKLGAHEYSSAAGHYLPGPGSHLARGRIAGLPVPGGGSSRQNRRAPAFLKRLCANPLSVACRKGGKARKQLTQSSPHGSYTSSDTALLRGGYDSCRNHSLNPRSRNSRRPSNPL